MTRLTELPGSFASTRESLLRVAVHLVARARQQGDGRFSLRVTPGGFGTPEFGSSITRIRVSDGLLVRDVDESGAAATAACEIDGATLAELAEIAGVDLAADLDVGHDTPPLGAIDEPLAVDAEAAAALGRWFGVVASALDRVVARVDVAAAPSLVRLWPEHFDAALDLAAHPDRRVNLGGSPGDAEHPDPYLYVGPWTDDRPGDAEFWNAPFGGVLGYRDLAITDDPVDAATEFFLRGVELLAD